MKTCKIQIIRVPCDCAFSIFNQYNPFLQRAHPNRLIAHNGEINTIRGNVDRMLAREESMSSDFLDANLKKILPVINAKGSDSAMLDNTLEF